MNIHTIIAAAALASSAIASRDLSAQDAQAPVSPAQPSHWELRVPGGALVPTGSQREVIKRGNLTAVQVSYVARPNFAVTSTLGWARSRDVATAGAPKLDVFTYDVGAELRAPRSVFSPFAGIGAGGRSYNYRKLDVDATHNLAAYGTVGGELGVRRVRVRLEARDYIAGFKPLAGEGSARIGNDVVAMVGFRLVSR
jgi:hypothetical protein